MAGPATARPTPSAPGSRRRPPPPPPPTDPARAPRHAARRVRPRRPRTSSAGPAGGSGFLTVRDLLFHLPRRYDDLREMRKLGDLAWVEDGTVVSRAGPRRRHPRRGVVPAPRPADDRGPRGRDRDRSRRPGSGAGSSSAGCIPGDRVIVSGKLKHFGRKLTLDNPDFQPEGREDELLHVGRIVPVYRLTAGLTANAPPDRDARGARPGRRRTTRSTCRRRSRASEELVGDRARRSRRPTTRRRSRVATRRSGGSPSTSCSRSSSGWSARRRQRGRDAARADRRRRRRRRRRSARARRRLARRGSSAATVELTPDQDAAIDDDPRRPRPRRRRCSACSRATSARARRPSRPMRWRRRRGPGCRARSSPRRTSSPGSTTATLAVAARGRGASRSSC